ncbi:hypothetical protein BX600DRAFT_515322 [Xylariales sp. PMI_506]|nr:hypothetical protein BX600DRAFT_515322 [Xylariales sp. PMI_506]
MDADEGALRWWVGVDECLSLSCGDDKWGHNTVYVIKRKLKLEVNYLWHGRPAGHKGLCRLDVWQFKWEHLHGYELFEQQQRFPNFNFGKPDYRHLNLRRTYQPAHDRYITAEQCNSIAKLFSRSKHKAFAVLFYFYRQRRRSQLSMRSTGVGPAIFSRKPKHNNRLSAPSSTDDELLATAGPPMTEETPAHYSHTHPQYATSSLTLVSEGGAAIVYTMDHGR